MEMEMVGEAAWVETAGAQVVVHQLDLPPALRDQPLLPLRRRPWPDLRVLPHLMHGRQARLLLDQSRPAAQLHSSSLPLHLRWDQGKLGGADPLLPVMMNSSMVMTTTVRISTEILVRKDKLMIYLTPN